MYSNSITKTVEKSIEPFRGLLTGLVNVGKKTIVLTFNDSVEVDQVETAINEARNAWKVSKWEYSHSDTASRKIKVFCHKL